MATKSGELEQVIATIGARMDDGSSSVLVVGDTFVDVLAGPLDDMPEWGHAVVSPAPIRALPGGCALNVASSLARLNVRTVLYSGIGNDAFGAIPRAHLSKMGVTLAEAQCSDPAAPTGVCMVISGTKDRSLVFHSGISDLFNADSLTEEVLQGLQPGVKHLHVSGFYSCAGLRRSLPGLLRRARACGLTTSLDPNNDPTGKWARVDGLWEDILPLCDVFLPNDLEALAIAQTALSGSSEQGESQTDASAKEVDFERCLDILSAQTGGGCVVVTQGDKGCAVRRRGSATTVVPTLKLPADQVIDTLGAGDAFTAGFLSKYVRGDSAEAAATFGCLNGTFCVTRRGAALQPPTDQQLLRFQEQYSDGGPNQRNC